MAVDCRCEVKVIDLGSSCFITDQLSSYVQSRSYRAPEVILGLPYDQKVRPQPGDR
jgi:serine/threonine protein kinase